MLPVTVLSASAKTVNNDPISMAATGNTSSDICVRVIVIRRLWLNHLLYKVLKSYLPLDGVVRRSAEERERVQSTMEMIAFFFLFSLLSYYCSHFILSPPVYVI